MKQFYFLKKMVLSLTVIGFCCFSLYAQTYNEVYVLGDSFSDVGNIKSFLSDVSFTNPFTNNFITLDVDEMANTQNDGTLFVEFLAESYGVTLIPSLIGGTNYAFDKATAIGTSLLDQSEDVIKTKLLESSLINRNTIQFVKNSVNLPNRNIGLNLATQVDQLIRDTNNNWDANSLVIVSIGIHDVMFKLDTCIRLRFNSPVCELDTPSDTETKNILDIVNLAIDSIEANIIRLLSYGVEDIFVVNLPDLGKLPKYNISLERKNIASNASMLFNGLLRERVSTLKKSYSSKNFKFIDFFTISNHVLNNPFDYGLINSTQACLQLKPGIDLDQDQNIDVFLTQNINTNFLSLVGFNVFSVSEMSLHFETQYLNGCSEATRDSFAFFSSTTGTESFYKAVSNQIITRISDRNLDLYEPFDYSTGSKLSRKSGNSEIGLIESWRNIGFRSHAFSLFGSLQYPTNTSDRILSKTIGNHLKATSYVNYRFANGRNLQGIFIRSFEFPIGDRQGRVTKWISLLIQPKPFSKLGFNGLHFLTDTGSDLFLGFGNNGSQQVWFFDAFGYNTGGMSSVPVVNNETVFLVGKVIFSGDDQPDRLLLFLNPDSNEPNDTDALIDITTTNFGNLHALALQWNIPALLDEIKIGNSYQSIVQ